MRRANHDIIELEVELIHQTEAAYLVAVGDIEAWVPKSRVELEMKASTGRAATIQIPEGLAAEKNLV